MQYGRAGSCMGVWNAGVFGHFVHARCGGWLRIMRRSALESLRYDIFRAWRECCATTLSWYPLFIDLFLLLNPCH